MNTHHEATDHPLTEGRAWDIYSDAHPVDAIRAAFDAGQKYQDDLEDDTIRNIMKDVHHLRVERDTADNVVADLTAKVARVEALADKLEREAEKEREKPNRDPHDYGWDDACTVAAHRIRAALNGDDQ